MSSNVVNELAFLFRATRPTRPVLLLGAGASFRSGIPMAADAVRKIARAAFARHVRGMPERQCNLTTSDWLPYLQKQPWFIDDPKKLAENFPFAVQHLLYPKEFRREFFMEMISARAEINKGYRHLANLVMRRLCWNVLTTNFDSCIVDGLREKKPHIREIVEINRTADDLVGFRMHNRCQVVYLHGSVEYYRDKNLIEETQKLDEQLAKRLRPMLNDSPLVVIGYRGAEPSITKHLLEDGLAESHNYRNGVFWCARKPIDLHPSVLALQGKLGGNFRLLEIEGFDELLEALDRELDGETWYSAAEEQLEISGGGLGAASYDSRSMDGTALEDLDQDLALATTVEYTKRLGLGPVTPQNFWHLMREQGLLTNRGGVMVPTIGCYLLFGRQVSDRFPYACISLTRGGKKRKVFEGNLISQFRNLLDYLNSDEINPLLRVKGNRKAESQPAYPERAIVELIVNMLVHRDYELEQYSTVDFEPGRNLRFSNPGGLLPNVFKQVVVDANGRFLPVRGITAVRNPRIADIFYGIGSMDKAGSGLADVGRLMQEYGGKAEFAVGSDNGAVQVTVLQAIQESPGTSRVAIPLSPSETFITNLLPFSVLPAKISILPLRSKPLPDMPLFEPEEVPSELPIFIRHGENLYTFADLQQFSAFADKRGFLDRISRPELEEFIHDDQQRNLFTWLVGKHWEFYLGRFKEYGLRVEFRRKRAYFQLVSGERNRIVYDSKLRKNVGRDVVKKRPKGNQRVEFENEGLIYTVVELDKQWAVQVKPFYLFTKRDGCSPLPAFLQTRRSTSRMKFDRNKSVADDLAFWSRFISMGLPTFNIGGVGVEDLILNSEFCAVEAQRVEATEKR